MKKRKIKVVIYIRYSSHNQDGSFSIEYQLAECQKFAEERGYEVVEIYIDQAKTGKKVAGRDAFDSMIYEASQKKFDKVIVFSFSRSFRNTRDALNYNHDLYEKYGIVIESVIERIDMTDPHGKFSGTNLFAMHELQSDITAAHVKSGMHVAAQQGYYLGGFIPLGYEVYGTGEFSRGKERKRYRINEEAAEIVREIYRLFADGFSIGLIQKIMRDKGVCGHYGDAITRKNISRTLHSEFYIGTRKFNIKGYEPLDIKNCVPAIIDMDTWNRVQARHAEHKAVKGRVTKRIYTLTGKMICAKCGAHMFGTCKHKAKTADGMDRAYYVCSNKKVRCTCDALSVRKQYIESYCLRQIKEHILNEEAMRAISAQIATEAGTSSDDMGAEKKKAERRIEKIAGILKNIKKDQYEGEITKELAEEMSAEYERELVELEIAVQALQQALQSAITPEGVYSYLQELLTYHNSNEDELIKVLFDKLIDKIIVHDDRIEVHMVVFPFAHMGYNSPSAPPHVRLSTQATKKEIGCKIKG